MPSMDAITELINKCLNLAGDKGATEAEAQAAAMKAQSLLLKYNLDMADIRRHGNTEEVPVIEVNLILSQMWRAALMNGVANCNFCRVVYSRSSGMGHLIGEPINVLVVTRMCDYLEQCFVRLAKEQRPAHKRLNTWESAFCMGAAEAVIKRLKAMQETAKTESSSTMALVVLKDQAAIDKLNELHPNVYYPRDNHKYDSAAYSSGYAAGRSVNLHDPVSSRASQTQIR